MPDLTKLVGFRASWPEFDLRGTPGFLGQILGGPAPKASIHEGWVIGPAGGGQSLDLIVVIEDGATKAKSIRLEEATITPIYRD